MTDISVRSGEFGEYLVTDFNLGPLKVYKIHPDVPDLEYATERSACFDLRAYFHGESIKIWDKHNLQTVVEGYERLVLEHRERVLIPTGMILDIPDGYSVRLHPRSGNSIKNGITLANSEGVVDSDYVHQLYVPLINLSKVGFEINHGDRIAQAEIVPVYHMNVSYVDEAPKQKTSRAGGFGSTGLK